VQQLTTRLAPGPAEQEKRRGLRKMKLVALSFLLGATVVFLAAVLWPNGPAFVGYVQAAAEAGMVGALADWFAVTALFRHPLGIPIPHNRDHPEPQGPAGQQPR